MDNKSCYRTNSYSFGCIAIAMDTRYFHILYDNEKQCALLNNLELDAGPCNKVCLNESKDAADTCSKIRSACS